MKLFKAITTVAGMKEPFVDHYEAETEAEARVKWDGECRHNGLPLDKTTVAFVEVDPKTLQPK